MKYRFGYFCRSCTSHWSTWKKFMGAGGSIKHVGGGHKCPRCESWTVHLQNYAFCDVCGLCETV